MDEIDVLACTDQGDEWDDAYHSSLVKYITTQRELLALRRAHEEEVGTMHKDLKEKTLQLDEAEKTVASLADKDANKADKMAQLNQELTDVQELLSETETKHKKLSDKLDNMRANAKKSESKSSDTKLQNDKMREELKAHNRKLAVKQTDLIGRRHQVHVAKEQSSYCEGEDLEDLEDDEKEELKAKLVSGLAKIEEFMGGYVEKRRAYLTEAMGKAAKDMDFEAAAEFKADLMELSAKYDDPDL